MSNMQLDTLRRIVQEINASTSLHESLDIMVNQVAEAMHVDVAPFICSMNATSAIC